MTTYATALATAGKKVIWVLDFTGHSNQRYCNSPEYIAGANISSPAASGLVVQDALQSSLDLRTGDIDFDEIEVILLDVDGAVGTFLSTNDGTLFNSAAVLKYGFVDVAEGSFQSINLLVGEWGRKKDGGFFVTLRSAVSFLDSSLFSDIGNNSFTLKEAFTLTDTTVEVDGEVVEAGWRAAGNALLTDQETTEQLLVTYTGVSQISQSQSRLTGVTAQVFDVGANGRVWTAEQTDVSPCWAFNDDPINVFLRFATTTDAGTNGTYDAADGDGLGDQIPVANIDLTTFETLRDQWFAGVDGNPKSAIYIGTEPIDSVLEYWAEEFLAMGFYFGVTADGKLTLRQLIDLSATPTVITGKVNLEGDVFWQRGYDRRENSVRWLYDYAPGTDEFLSSADLTDTSSSDSYTASKQRDVESRGARGRLGSGFGFPDLEWDAYLLDRACDYLTQFGNPSAPVTVMGFLELQDIEVGTLVQLTHPTVYDLDGGSLGVTDALFYVVGVERSPRDGAMRLDILQRRQIGRPWFIAPDSIEQTYGGATASEKQFGYIPPDAGNFTDGQGPYDTGI